MILFSVLMLTAQVAAPPAAPAMPVQATAPAAAPAKVKEKKICKTDPESDPGSHMVKTTCHTQAEWNHVVTEDDSALTADASGRVRRNGVPVAPGDPAWVVPPEVRAHAVC